MDKCPRYGKRKYRTEEEANRGRWWIWSHDPSAKLDDLHVYLCELCNYWHIGHWSKYNGQRNNQTNDRGIETDKGKRAIPDRPNKRGSKRIPKGRLDTSGQ